MRPLFRHHGTRRKGHPRPGSFSDDPDDWGEPDEPDDDRCVHCGAEIGHYNGCTEDPDAMCLCHLCMEDPVTSEADCPYHGAEAPARPSWRARLSARCDRVSAWWDRHFYDPWDHGLDDRDIADVFGATDVPRRGGMMEGPEVPSRDVPVHAVKPCAAPGGPDVPRSAPRGPRDGPGHCPNCGRPAYDGRVCGACGWGYGYQPACEAAVAAVYAPGTLDVTPQDFDATEIFSQPRQCAGRDVRDIWQPPARPLEPWIQALLGAPTVADAMRDIITGAQRPALEAVGA